MRCSPGSGVGIENSARFNNGRRSAADGHAQFVPAHRVPITARAWITRWRSPVRINGDVMRCPQPSISDVRRKQSIVECIQPNARGKCLHTADVGIRTARDWFGRRVYRDRDVCRNAGGTAGIADSPHDQAAECGVARTDDVAFSCVWIVVINTARTIRAIVSVNESAESGDHHWSAAENRAFLDDEDGGIKAIVVLCRRHAICRRDREHIAADVKSVGVDTKRVIIEKLLSIRSTDRVLLDEEVGPHGAVRDHAVTCRVRNRNQDAIGLVSDAAR
jgi:hypothetical protein